MDLQQSIIEENASKFVVVLAEYLEAILKGYPQFRRQIRGLRDGWRKVEVEPGLIVFQIEFEPEFRRMLSCSASVIIKLDRDKFLTAGAGFDDMRKWAETSILGKSDCYCSGDQCYHTVGACRVVLDQLQLMTMQEAVDLLKRGMARSVDWGDKFVNEWGLQRDSRESIASQALPSDAKSANSRFSPSKLAWMIFMPEVLTGPLDEEDYESSKIIQPFELRFKRNGEPTIRRDLFEDEDSIDIQELTQKFPESLDVLAKMIALQGLYSHSAELLLSIFRELAKGTHWVCLSVEFRNPVKVREEQLTIRLDEVAEGFRPKCCLGDNFVISLSSRFRVVKSQTCAMLYGVDEEDAVLFAETTPQIAGQIENLIKTFEFQNVVLSENATQRFVAKLENAPAASRLAVRLPQVLEGVEEPLQPKIELHIDPKDPTQPMVEMLVACHAAEESLVPGVGQSKIPVNTPAGRVILVRTLEAETAEASRISDQLKMGDFSYCGPYQWKLESIDQVLDVIARCHALGEQAPEICWPRGEELKYRGDLDTENFKVEVTKEKDWFGLKGTFDLDGIQVSLVNLLSSLRRGSRYVLVGPGEYAKINNDLRKRLNTIEDVTQVENDSLRVSRAAAPIVEKTLGDDISVKADASWNEAIKRIRAGIKRKVSVPKGLKADLRDYQVAGYQWLSRLSYWGIGGCLADDMGLGKTLQTLGVLLERASDGPALILAPTSVGTNWLREANKFAPSLNPILFREVDREATVRDAKEGDLVIVSYQLFRREKELFASRSWNTLILDEAQFVKNFATQTAQAVRSVEANWSLALSGTPLENHLGELWSLMRMVSPGLLGSWDRFRKRFAEPIERNRDTEKLQSLCNLIQPYILRRTKAEVLTELPPRTEIVRSTILSAAEKKKYDTACLAALSDLSTKGERENEQTRRIRVLAWLTKLRQLACHPAMVDKTWKKSSAKLDLFLEIFEELKSGGHRALVFSQFVQHLSLVRQELDKRKIVYQYLDGSSPTSQRQEAIDAFQNGKGDLFLISLKAGGTGLNLTAADYVIHLDPWWNPSVEDQATDRAHRFGQVKPVTVYRLVTKDTIEEQILGLHNDKRDLIASVLDGTDRAGKLRADELVKLIQAGQLQESQ